MSPLCWATNRQHMASSWQKLQPESSSLAQTARNPPHRFTLGKLGLKKGPRKVRVLSKLLLDPVQPVPEEVSRRGEPAEQSPLVRQVLEEHFERRVLFRVGGDKCAELHESLAEWALVERWSGRGEEGQETRRALMHKLSALVTTYLEHSSLKVLLEDLANSGLCWAGSPRWETSSGTGWTRIEEKFRKDSHFSSALHSFPRVNRSVSCCGLWAELEDDSGWSFCEHQWRASVCCPSTMGSRMGSEELQVSGKRN